MKKPHIDNKIFKKFNARLVYIFGSQAKGNADSGSDIDLAVLFKKKPVDPLALKDFSSLSGVLTKFFQARLDLVSLNDASLLLKYEVITPGQPLYCEDAAARINLEVSVIKEYIDEKPLRNLYNRALHQRILQGD